jgi:hypothetical protein
LVYRGDSIKFWARATVILGQGYSYFGPGLQLVTVKTFFLVAASNLDIKTYLYLHIYIGVTLLCRIKEGTCSEGVQRQGAEEVMSASTAEVKGRVNEIS